jgi:hypothetical protein
VSAWAHWPSTITTSLAFDFTGSKAKRGGAGVQAALSRGGQWKPP